MRFIFSKVRSYPIDCILKVYEKQYQIFHACVGIHGDEVVGRELVLYLARSLLEQHGHDTAVTTLLDNTEIHILPR